MSVVAPAAGDPKSYAYLRELVFNELGIVLDAGKDYLIDSRLGPIARKEGLPGLDGLVAALRTGTKFDLKRSILDAMTTNETTFLRDVTPFEVLQQSVLPKLIEARRAKRKLRIWYAASSYGQEPYSVSMLMHDNFPELMGWQLEQVGTDICRTALDRARAGRYSQLEVNRGLPARLLVKHFKKEGADWQISDTIRKMVKFEELNLIGRWPPMGTFDVVFIRNVLIYFDTETKKRIIGRIHDMLAPDGYMFLGAAETTLNIDERFARAEGGKGGCYRLAKAAQAAA
jgi:chemotaxis protein methyltransferase CheR